MNGEEVVYFGKVHWFVFIPGILFTVIGFMMLSVDDESGVFPIFGSILFLYGLFRLIDAILKVTTTELALTSKRVIAKIGFIRRNTIELNHNKVESFNVNQGIMGRIFGFGTVAINGTGGGKTPILNVANPLEFRRQAMELIDEK